LPNGAHNHPALIGGAQLNRKNCEKSELDHHYSANSDHLLTQIAQSLVLPGIPTISFILLYISLSFFLHLSLFPISIFLTISISLRIAENKNDSKNGKIGEQKIFPALLPIGTEIAYSFCSTWRKRKLETTAKLKDQRTSIATAPVPNVCPLSCPPWFSLQTTYNDDL
jgi:hypothetical protein